MDTPAKFWRRIRMALFERFGSDLGEEMRFHREEAERERVEAGMSPAEARAAVSRNFGNAALAAEDSRGVWLASWAESLLQDARYGARILARNPGFAVVAVLTLALGLFVNIVLFSVVNAVLLSPLPLPEPERLVIVNEQHAGAPPQRLTGGAFHDLHERARLLQMAAYRVQPANFGSGSLPDAVDAAYVSEDFFRVMGIGPVLGRAFAPEDFQESREIAVLLSDGFWRRHFGGDERAIGQEVTVHGRAARVVGVLPRGFAIPENVSLWAPLTRDHSLPQNHRAHLFNAVGRIAPGSTLEQANAELATLSPAMAQAEGTTTHTIAAASGMQRQMVAGIRPALLVLLASGSLLLLIACANVANLLLARGAGRSAELAVRLALGATRRRITRQLLVESIALAIPASGAGMLLTWWALKLTPLLASAGVPRLHEIGINATVVAFSTLLAMATAVVSGLAPSLRLPRLALSSRLGSGGRTVVASSAMRLWLVSVQVALALVLLVGAGLLVRSSLRLQRVDRGFDSERVLTVAAPLAPASHPNWQAAAQFSEAVRGKLAALPGVELAASVSSLPTRGAPVTDFEIDRAGTTPVLGWVISVSPDYFRTMRIPLLRGRAITTADTAGAPLAIVISQSMAQSCWPGEDPIGHRLTMKDWGDPLPATVVGVVADVRQDGLEQPGRPGVYFATAQFPNGVLTNYWVLRASGDAAALASLVTAQVRAVDRNQPVSAIVTMNDVMAISLARQRLNVLLLAGFGVLAFAIAMAGLYSAMSYAVAQRRRDIAIRMALGAQRAGILLAVMTNTVSVVVFGIAAGVLAALGVTRFMRGMLFGVQATDPETFAVVAAAVAVVSVMAGYLPARRATLVDPMTVLRCE